MIKHINGNILDSKADVIFHQVNCRGVMGSGIAKQIREWCPAHYTDYIGACEHSSKPEELLGKVVLTPYDCVNKLYICGVFGQLNYGRDSKCYTDYEAVKRALIDVKVMAIRCECRNFRFAVPYKMSCGLAGGDWKIVYTMLEEIFCDAHRDAHGITLEVWRLP